MQYYLDVLTNENLNKKNLTPPKDRFACANGVFKCTPIRTVLILNFNAVFLDCSFKICAFVHFFGQTRDYIENDTKKTISRWRRRRRGRKIKWNNLCTGTSDHFIAYICTHYSAYIHFCAHIFHSLSSNVVNYV